MQPRLEQTCSKRIQRRAAAQILTLALLVALAPHPAHAQIPGDAAAEIVYIDPSGVVRVRDPAPAGVSGVTWFSPVGGYIDAILLDVNGDGDMEIAALREAGGARSLDIYDPVLVTGPVAPGQSIGGVPWAQIATIPIAKPVGILAAGEIDGTTRGDEIVLSARDAASGAGGSTLYKQSLSYLRNVGAQNGTAWESVGLPISSEDWTSVALGDMNGDTVDEIALDARASGTLTVWQMRGPYDAVRVYKNESSNRRWFDVAMGSFRGGNDMLGAVRDAPNGLPSLVIFRWQDGTLADEFGAVFEPSPEFVFFADINGNGTANVYMIRFVDPVVTNKVRLIMQPPSSNTTALIEDVLDADNGYKVGAAGDIDGDGRDEVVLMRNNSMREYASPETTRNYAPTSVQTNSRTLVIGDLDGAGYLPEVNLRASPAGVVVQNAPSGTPSTVTTLTISGAPDSPAISISFSIAGRPAWLSVVADRFVTPAQLTLSFDATALLPGAYSTSLAITSASPIVLRQPLVVPISFVVSNGLLVRPAGMAFIFDGCEAAGLQTQQFAIQAPAGTAYSVSLLSTGAAEAATALEVPWPSSVAWLTAASATGIAPESVMITANSANVPAGATWQSARAVIMATVDGEQLVRTVPITLLCATTRAWLPAVARY